MSAGSGPGRRLTAAEEDQAAGLYQANASTREVASALGISRSSAQQLRLRLQREGRLAGSAPAAETEETTMPERDEHQDQDDAAELGQLVGEREDLIAEVGKYASRAEASVQAVAALEEERIRALADGRDAQALRGRRRDAEDDARDSADAAEIARGRLGEVDRKIQVVLARQADRQLRAELAAAVAARDVVLAAVGGRQRAAVTGIRALAEDFTAAYAEERDAVRRVEELAARVALGGPAPVVPPAVSTGLWLAGDVVGGPPVSLLRAINEARAGNVTAVCRQLGEVNGWLPPDPALLAADRERRERLYAQQDPVRPAPSQPWPYPEPTPVGVDSAGNPLPWIPPERRHPIQVQPGALDFPPLR